MLSLADGPVLATKRGKLPCPLLGWKAVIEPPAISCDAGKVSHSSTLIAARQFISTVWDGDVPTDEDLLAALDRLVAAYHDTPPGDVTDEKLDAPREDGPSIYRKTAARFRAYGVYPVADPTKAIDEPLMLGDAIDDLADLTLDMREVIWFAEHVGLADAHFSFRLHFFHWGQHARELSLYLCGRLWG